MAAAFVQSASSSIASGSSGTISVTINGVTAGNCLIVAAFSLSATESFDSCADGTNTYTAAATHQNGDGSGGRVFVAPNVSSGNFTVTATLSGDASYRVILVHEVSGIATTSPVDAVSSSLDCDNSGSDTPNENGCYIFGAGYTGYSATAATAGGSFTLRESQTDAAGVAAATEDQVQATAASISSNFTFGDNGGTGWMVALKPAAGGGGGGRPNFLTMLGVS